MDDQNIANMDIREEAQSALRPNFAPPTAQDFASLNDPVERPEVAAPVDEEEGALYAVSVSDGWEILESFISELKDELDALVREAMTKEASFEEIGQKTMVKELAKDYLDRVLEKVHTAHDAVENQKNG